jgi:dipeptidyl aminopeptidase/acylaminoacyl peptidase
VRKISYRAGGQTLTGWVVLPPGYRSGRRPAIVWIYGGQLLGGVPPLETRPGGGPTPVFDGQLWAAQGYAVIYPSTPIVRGADNDVAARLAEAATAAVDAASAEGWVDLERVGIIGHSFGGYSTAAVLSRRSDRFNAGVAMSGVFDYAVGWGARAPSESMVDANGHGFTQETRVYVERGQAGLQVPPWMAPDAYVRVSPFYDAPKIRTPLLLTVGDFDLGITQLQQSERFYAALQRAGSPAVLVRYWGEGHTQTDPGAVRDQWTRFNAWFGRYLAAGLGASEPVNRKALAVGPPRSPAVAFASDAPTPPPRPPRESPSAGHPG